VLPTLVHIGSVAVPSHAFFIALGLCAALAVFVYEARRRGMLSEDTMWIVAGALIAGGLAARLGMVWRYVDAAPHPTVLGFFLEGGRSIIGGLAGAYAGAILTKHLLGYRRSTGDLFAPAVALGMAIGRWGCFLTEQVGTPTTLPWGIRLSPTVGARIPNCAWCASGVAMHPSFLYEIAFHAAMFAVLWWWLRPRVRVEGELFKIYLLAYALFRFAVEFVRGNEIVWHGLTRSQMVLIPGTLLLVAYFARQWRSGVYGQPMPVPAPAAA
jgi:phosphatidylglycerol:prolipoprotein diacylglycerol transferase